MGTVVVLAIRMKKNGLKVPFVPLLNDEMVVERIAMVAV